MKRRKDSVMWMNAAWKCLIEDWSKVEWNHVVWFSQCNPKQAFILWMAIRVWKRIQVKSNMYRRSHSMQNVVDVLAAKAFKNNINNIAYRLILSPSVYYIWNERNKRMFPNTSRTQDELAGYTENNVGDMLKCLKALSRPLLGMDKCNIEVSLENCDNVKEAEGKDDLVVEMEVNWKLRRMQGSGDKYVENEQSKHDEIKADMKNNTCVGVAVKNQTEYDKKLIDILTEIDFLLKILCMIGSLMYALYAVFFGTPHKDVGKNNEEERAECSSKNEKVEKNREEGNRSMADNEDFVEVQNRRNVGMGNVKAKPVSQFEFQPKRKHGKTMQSNVDLSAIPASRNRKVMEFLKEILFLLVYYGMGDDEECGENRKNRDNTSGVKWIAALRESFPGAIGFPLPPPNKYYLCDAAYANTRGFLAPYRNTRNVIERSYGVLKARFPILKQMASYKFEVQRDVVIACFAIHNFIRKCNIQDHLFEEFDEDSIFNNEEEFEGHVEEEADAQMGCQNSQTLLADVCDEIANWDVTRVLSFQLDVKV
ncbi:putative nuclease HARBI1 [Tanacetum coccineum]